MELNNEDLIRDMDELKEGEEYYVKFYNEYYFHSGWYKYRKVNKRFKFLDNEIENLCRIMTINDNIMIEFELAYTREQYFDTLIDRNNCGTFATFSGSYTCDIYKLTTEYILK